MLHRTEYVMFTKQQLVVAVATVFLSAGAMAHESKSAMKPAKGGMNSAQVQKIVAGWPQASRDAIKFMTDKYGGPAAVTADAAMWGKTGPWKRTMVYRAEVPHMFPKAHVDVMQQWVDYRAPAGKFDELAAYDGSVVLERTAGEMSARCDKEGANFLAVNLADEVARGKRSVEDARMKYGEQIMAMMAKKPAPYTARIMFSPMGNTQDPDRALPGM